ncbi:MAG: adenylate/guanylate cyclase domain-containing protein [Acidobacteriota bacterium]|nr:adenylate/guanylate cyclase domain-containing protein [Acidobacteriota bacterium]
MPCPAREIQCHLALAELEWRAGRTEASAEGAAYALSQATAIGATELLGRARAAGERTRVDSILATVLFTDIVSSTERLRDVGDLAWNAHLERHNAVVRRELERFGGREVKTTGDGFLATFASPANGVRAALAISGALRDVGIDVRAGLHTGEVQVLADDIAGLAVHLAARVSAVAGAGEVLVSSTVRDLTMGSALRYDDRGPHVLKGIDGEWRLYRAASRD